MSGMVTDEHANKKHKHHVLSSSLTVLPFRHKLTFKVETVCPSMSVPALLHVGFNEHGLGAASWLLFLLSFVSQQICPCNDAVHVLIKTLPWVQPQSNIRPSFGQPMRFSHPEAVYFGLTYGIYRKVSKFSVSFSPRKCLGVSINISSRSNRARLGGPTGSVLSQQSSENNWEPELRAPHFDEASGMFQIGLKEG